MQKAPRPHTLKLKVKSHKWLNHKVVRIDVEVLEPADFDFIPGQHITIRIDDNTFRQYSIHSDLSDKHNFSFVVSAGHHGAGADFLKNLQPGDVIQGLGPLGRFWINTDYKPNIQIYASGTGVSPITTILNQMRLDGVKSKIRLAWGLHSEDLIMLLDEFEEFKKDLDFDYEIYLSEPSPDWVGKTGYVTKGLRVEPDTQYYVFGVQEMVYAVKEALKSSGVNEKDIVG